jgi:hypothetical protein
MPLCCGTVHPDDILTSCIKNAYDDQTKSTQDMMHYWYVYPAMTIVTLLPIWLLAWLGYRHDTLDRSGISARQVSWTPKPQPRARRQWPQSSSTLL